MLKSFLQGSWLGHPLHPALVHLPTALWPAALVFDVLSRTTDDPEIFLRTSFTCIAAGLVVALLAVPTGIADWLDIKPEKPAWKLGLLHAGLNATIAVLWVISLFIRWEHWDSGWPIRTLPLTLSIVANGLLLVSGWIGGRMVFEHGIGVARMSKQEWRERANRDRANLPPEKKE